MEDEPQTAARVSRAIKLENWAKRWHGERPRDGASEQAGTLDGGKARETEEKREFHGGGASGCNEWNFESELYNKIPSSGREIATRIEKIEERRRRRPGSKLQSLQPPAAKLPCETAREKEDRWNRRMKETEPTILGCVGKEHRRGIIHLQGIILFLVGLPEVRASTLSPISPHLPATPPRAPARSTPLYSAAGKIVARNSRSHCLPAKRADPETFEQRTCESGSASAKGQDSASSSFEC